MICMCVLADLLLGIACSAVVVQLVRGPTALQRHSLDGLVAAAHQRSAPVGRPYVRAATRIRQTKRSVNFCIDTGLRVYAVIDRNGRLRLKYRQWISEPSQENATVYTVEG
jgi:hypothetical protein